LIARVVRNQRRACSVDGSEIPPIDLVNMREHGVRSVEAKCEACEHEAIVNGDALPADLPVPEVTLRLRCSDAASKPRRGRIGACLLRPSAGAQAGRPGPRSTTRETAERKTTAIKRHVTPTRQRTVRKKCDVVRQNHEVIQ
jgi:hypothetical protein